MKRSALSAAPMVRLGLLLSCAVLLDGCASQRAVSTEDALLRQAAEEYAARCKAGMAADTTPSPSEILSYKSQIPWPSAPGGSAPGAASCSSAAWPIALGAADLLSRDDAARGTFAAGPIFTLGSFDLGQDPEPEVGAATASAPCVPEGYWRADVWHQMGHEALELATHGFWRGFKVSFWDVENALVLTAAMGASITIRETGVDDAIRRRTKGQNELGSMDETIQILGNPGTHFAGAGALWLASALTKDVREHEVAKSLVEALAVNGVSTILLKVATNTRAPDGEDYAWPSGHASSSFCTAAVLNEYYGPWVGIPSFALAGLVGYQRLDSRVHDFSDVVFGSFMGYVIGSSIAKDNKMELPELFGMKVIPFADPQTGASGLALFKQW